MYIFPNCQHNIAVTTRQASAPICLKRTSGVNRPSRQTVPFGPVAGHPLTPEIWDFPNVPEVTNLVAIVPKSVPNCDHNRPVPIGSKSVPVAGSQFYQMHMRVMVSSWSQIYRGFDTI